MLGIPSHWAGPPHVTTRRGPSSFFYTRSASVGIIRVSDERLRVVCWQWCRLLYDITPSPMTYGYTCCWWGHVLTPGQWCYDPKTISLEYQWNRLILEIKNTKLTLNNFPCKIWLQLLLVEVRSHSWPMMLRAQNYFTTASMGSSQNGGIFFFSLQNMCTLDGGEVSSWLTRSPWSHSRQLRRPSYSINMQGRGMLSLSRPRPFPCGSTPPVSRSS